MDSNRAAPTNGHDSWNVTINHLRFGGARDGQYGQCIQCIMFFQFPRRLDWNHDAPCHWLARRINPWQFAVTHRNPILGQARKRLADGVAQHAKHVEFRLTNGSLFEGWNHRSIQRLAILFDAKLLNHPSATGWWFQPLWKIWSPMGRMTSHISWKIQFMFETTNQPQWFWPTLVSPEKLLDLFSFSCPGNRCLDAWMP